MPPIRFARDTLLCYLGRDFTHSALCAVSSVCERKHAAATHHGCCMTRGLLLLCYCLRSTGALSRAQIPPHVPTLTGTAEATLTHEWRGLKFAGSTLCFSHTQDGAKSRMRLRVGCGRCRYHAPFLSSVEHIRTLQRNFVADLTAEMVRSSSAHTHLPTTSCRCMLG